MNITINGYTIELEYFPGTPGDEGAAPTDEDYEIISVVNEDTGLQLTSGEEFAFLGRKCFEILAAIHAKLEEEAAQSQFEDPDERRMYR